MSGRLRLWLERAGAGVRMRDAATGEVVAWEDERIRVIPVDGALFSAGDGHAAQGDGEISGTAIECPVRAQVALDLRDDLQLDWPCARIPGAWLTFGFDEHLGLAAKKAADGMIALMVRERGLGPDDALALASVVVDLRVTQVVNGQVGVHAVLRDDAWS